MTFPSASTAIAKRPEAVRAEIASDPERLELLKSATGELATAVQRFVQQYVALPNEDTAETVALWALHTWVINTFDTPPYLLIVSQEPGAGKTRLLEALAYVVRRPWITSGSTHTAMFRKIDQEQPTVLVDELDCGAS